MITVKPEYTISTFCLFKNAITSSLAAANIAYTIEAYLAPYDFIA